MNVFSFWTGPPAPPWIRLCLESLTRATPSATILDGSVWRDWYDGEIPVETIERQFPNVQSDILRAWILSRHGGIWIDADAIVWRDLTGLADVLGNADFLCYRVAGTGEICSALLAARPTSIVAQTYWGMMRWRVAEAGDRRLPKLAAGPRLLRRAIRAARRAEIRWLPPEHVHPLHWRERARLLARVAPEIDPRAWCWMLTHRALGPLRRASRARILASPTLAGQLFRRAQT